MAVYPTVWSDANSRRDIPDNMEETLVSASFMLLGANIIRGGGMLPVDFRRSNKGGSIKQHLWLAGELPKIAV